MEDQGIQEIINKKGLDTNNISVTIQQVREDNLELLYSSLPINLLGLPLVRSLRNRPGNRIGIVGRAVLQGQSNIVSDVTNDTDYVQLSPDTKSELAIPIKFDGGVVAVVNFESPQAAFFGPDQSEFFELAEELARYLRLSVNKERIERLWRDPPFIDPSSTGLVHTTIEEVSLSLIRELAINPQWLHNLTSRKFEELIAKLLSDKGYLVTLTPPQKDGGRDILASIYLPTGKILTIVECKKWAPNRPVPVSVIRGVYGVLVSEKANQAMIATTSRFTAPAQQFVSSTKYQMSLKDYDDIAGWLKSYN